MYGGVPPPCPDRVKNILRTFEAEILKKLRKFSISPKLDHLIKGLTTILVVDSYLSGLLGIENLYRAPIVVDYFLLLETSSYRLLFSRLWGP